MQERRQRYQQQIEHRYRPVQSDRVRGFLAWTSHTMIADNHKTAEYYRGSIEAIRIQVDAELRDIAKWGWWGY